jgi:gluconolactonase
MVDIPYGRILQYSISSGAFQLCAQWEGEPNGLALRDDGHLIVADYKDGLVSGSKSLHPADISSL